MTEKRMVVLVLPVARLLSALGLVGLLVACERESTLLPTAVVQNTTPAPLPL